MGVVIEMQITEMRTCLCGDVLRMGVKTVTAAGKDESYERAAEAFHSMDDLAVVRGWDNDMCPAHRPPVAERSNNPQGGTTT